MANKPGAAAAPPELQEDAVEDEDITEVDVGDLMHRPDGYYWQTPDGTQEFGPFESLELALAHMQSTSEEDVAEPGEALREAEDEIGVADWVDPDTGVPAEGLSTPHLNDE